MKKLYLLINFVCFSIFGLNAQSKSGKKKWEQDAKQLTARIAKKQGAQGKAQLSMATITDLESALEAVSNSEDPNARFVIDDLGIRAASIVDLNQVDLLIDETITWAQEWWSGDDANIPTELKGVIEEYGLRMDRLSQEAGMYCFALISEEELNMTYLAYELSYVEGVLMASVPNAKQNVNDIEAKTVNGGWMISYIYRFETCNSACTKKHTWDFGIDYAGNVTFVDDYGAELPAEAGAIIGFAAEEVDIEQD